MAKMSTCHAWMAQCRPILYLKWPRYLHVMLGWFSADPSYLKWPRCLHVMLGWFSADPSYLKWPRCLHVMLGWFSVKLLFYYRDVQGRWVLVYGV
jgi:hypothetical protein